jgi:hypothetical protein
VLQRKPRNPPHAPLIQSRRAYVAMQKQRGLEVAMTFDDQRDAFPEKLGNFFGPCSSVTFVWTLRHDNPNVVAENAP